MGIKLGDHINYDIKNWITEEEAERIFKAAGYIELNEIAGYKVIQINPNNFEKGIAENFKKETGDIIKNNMKIKVNISPVQFNIPLVEDILEDAIEKLIGQKDFKSFGLKGVV